MTATQHYQYRGAGIANAATSTTAKSAYSSAVSSTSQQITHDYQAKIDKQKSANSAAYQQTVNDAKVHDVSKTQAYKNAQSARNKA